METITRPAQAKYLACERSKLAMASSDKQTKEQSAGDVFSKALLSRTVMPPVIGQLFGRPVWGHGQGKVMELFTNVGCSSSCRN